MVSVLYRAFCLLVLFFAFAAASVVRAQLPAEFEESTEEQPRRFLGLIGGQITKVTGESPGTNGALVFSGYTVLMGMQHTGVGVTMLAGMLGRRDMIHGGVSVVRYFGSELGTGPFVQANAGITQFYENFIAFNSPPEVTFGAYLSAGYSLKLWRSIPGIQLGVVYGFYPASARTYNPIGLQACFVF